MAAYTDEIDFESPTYSTGDIDGQDSWSANSTIHLVTTDQAAEGSQAVKWVNGGGNCTSTRSVSAVSDDNATVYVSWYISDLAAAGNTNLIFYNNSSLVGSVGIRSDSGTQKIFVRDNASWDVESTISVSTWTRVGIQWDFTNKQYRFSVNNGSWGSWSAFGWGSTQTQFNRIDFQSNNSGSVGTFYWDYLSADYTAAATPDNALFMSNF